MQTIRAQASKLGEILKRYGLGIVRVQEALRLAHRTVFFAVAN